MSKLIKGSDISDAQKLIFKTYKDRLNLKSNRELCEHWAKYEVKESSVQKWASGSYRFSYYWMLRDLFPHIGDDEFRNKGQFVAYLYWLDNKRFFPS